MGSTKTSNLNEGRLRVKAIFGRQSRYWEILYIYATPNLRFDFLALHGGVRLIQTVLLHEY